jgi:hypothetical protein
METKVIKMNFLMRELLVIHASLIVAKNNAIDNLNDPQLKDYANKNLDQLNPLIYEFYSYIKENQEI